MFDKETIIVKSPNGISTWGVVEWLGQRSDAMDLEVQSIVYRRTPNSPDEYLKVNEYITARELFLELEPVITGRAVIDYCVTTGQGFSLWRVLEAHNDYIGTRDEYAADLKSVAKGTDDEQIDWDEFIHWDIVGGQLIEGVLTGDLFKAPESGPLYQGDTLC